MSEPIEPVASPAHLGSTPPLDRLPSATAPGLAAAAVASPAHRPEPLFPISTSWKVAAGASIVMCLLAILGVGLSTSNSAAALPYWIALVPVFGAICVGTAWARARHNHGLTHPDVLRQLLHWTAIAGALSIDFAIRGSGVETGTAAGLNAMLLIALGCFLAGVHLEWLFVPVGLLIAAALLLVAKADQYIWLILVVGGAAIVVLVLLYRMLDRPPTVPPGHSHPMPSTTP